MPTHLVELSTLHSRGIHLHMANAHWFSHIAVRLMTTSSRVKVSARPIVEWPQHLLKLTARTMSYLHRRWPNQSFKEVLASHMAATASLAARPLPARGAVGRVPRCPRDEAAVHGISSWSSTPLCMMQRCPHLCLLSSCLLDSWAAARCLLKGSSARCSPATAARRVPLLARPPLLADCRCSPLRWPRGCCLSCSCSLLEAPLPAPASYSTACTCITFHCPYMLHISLPTTMMHVAWEMDSQVAAWQWPNTLHGIIFS
ncbi:hypothetical protein Dimus_026968 [Dionaea muscipula]